MPRLSFPYAIPSIEGGMFLQCYNRQKASHHFFLTLKLLLWSSGCRCPCRVLAAWLSFQNQSLASNTFWSTLTWLISKCFTHNVGNTEGFCLCNWIFLLITLCSALCPPSVHHISQSFLHPPSPSPLSKWGPLCIPPTLAIQVSVSLGIFSLTEGGQDNIIKRRFFLTLPGLHWKEIL